MREKEEQHIQNVFTEEAGVGIKRKTAGNL